jgi:hypothetical protein
MGWSQAIQELEAATRDLSALDLNGPVEADKVLARRQRALAVVAGVCQNGLVEVPVPQLLEFRERLDRVQSTGDLALARLLAQKQQASREWNHLRQLQRAVGDPSPGVPASVNCKG